MKSLRAAINEKLDKEGVAHVCSYGMRWTSGEERLQTNDVCYARVGWYSYYDRAKKGEICEIAISLRNALEYTKKANHLRKWVAYILIRSPFKDCFKTKNLQAAWRYGIQMDVEKSKSGVATALIALREGWEFPHILANFTMLVNNGINEDVAYIVSRMVALEKGKYFIYYWGGHQVLSILDVEGMRSFLKEGMYVHDGPAKTEINSYRIFRCTRSENATGGEKLINILFAKPSGVHNSGWEQSKYLTKKAFIVAAKRIEEALLS